MATAGQPLLLTTPSSNACQWGNLAPANISTTGGTTGQALIDTGSVVAFGYPYIGYFGASLPAATVYATGTTTVNYANTNSSGTNNNLTYSNGTWTATSVVTLLAHAQMSIGNLANYSLSINHNGTAFTNNAAGLTGISLAAADFPVTTVGIVTLAPGDTLTVSVTTSAATTCVANTQYANLIRLK